MIGDVRYPCTPEHVEYLFQVACARIRAHGIGCAARVEKLARKQIRQDVTESAWQKWWHKRKTSEFASVIEAARKGVPC